MRAGEISREAVYMARTQHRSDSQISVHWLSACRLVALWLLQLAREPPKCAVQLWEAKRMLERSSEASKRTFMRQVHARKGLGIWDG